MSNALKKNNRDVTYVNIKLGKLVIKKEDNTNEYFDSIEGVITNIDFEEKEYQDRKYEIAKISLNNVGDRFLLTMGVDSGYFRWFINFLRSANPTEMVTIKPRYSEADGKKVSKCFVDQNGKALKAFFKKDSMGDFPQMKVTEVDGKTFYDSSDQLAYWKVWVEKTFVYDNPNPDYIAANNAAIAAGKLPQTFIEPSDEELSDLPF
jgi:hypothetical protein